VVAAVNGFCGAAGVEALLAATVPPGR
jgi:hypothetical protein